jgi:hypothetical protein
MIDVYVIAPHAERQMVRRDLDVYLVDRILAAPEQWFKVGPGRVVLQSRVFMGTPEEMYLVRVFVDIERRPPEVITAYRTSKTWKYWKHMP